MELQHINETSQIPVVAGVKAQSECLQQLAYLGLVDSPPLRLITEQHAEKSTGLLHHIQSGGSDPERLQNDYRAAIAAYGEDFGDEADARLDAHARHKARKAARDGHYQGR